MQNDISNIIRFIKQLTKKDLALFDKEFFRHTLEKRIKKCGLRTPVEYYHLISEHPEEINHFIRSFHVTYSEFFRDSLVFALLSQWILPPFFSKKENLKKKEIRIWSAAGAAGQEAYSIAMLIDDIKSFYHSEIAVHIFSSDISDAEIKKARKGFYPASQLQKIPLKYLNEYFYPEGTGYKLIPRIRESVIFSSYDLLDKGTISPPESIFGSFDLIFCSNLFIYYNATVRSQIIQKLKRNLTNDGFLITGDSEREILAQHKLYATCAPAAIFQNKSTPEVQ